MDEYLVKSLNILNVFKHLHHHGDFQYSTCTVTRLNFQMNFQKIKKMNLFIILFIIFVASIPKTKVINP